MAKYFKDCKCIEDVKEEYRRLAKNLHPDNGGSDAEFQVMMKDYTAAYNRFKSVHRNKTEKNTSDARNAAENAAEGFTAEQFADIVNKVLFMDGVQIEIVGSWIWLSGNTYIYKDVIKAAGFFWSTKHKKWYYNGGTRKSKKHSKMSYDEIKSLHGSYNVKKEYQAKLA